MSLVAVSLSERAALASWRAGDALILARVCRHLNSGALTSAFATRARTAAELSRGLVPSARVHLLDEISLGLLTPLVEQ